MRVYYVSYTHEEGGTIEAFKSKRKALSRLSEILREYRGHQKHLQDGSYNECRCTRYDFISEQVFQKEFPITADGIIEAFNDGAWSVSK